MVKKITFLAKIIGIFLLTTIILNAIELKIIPQKKPNISNEIKEKKISKNIIIPKKKPSFESKKKKN